MRLFNGLANITGSNYPFYCIPEPKDYLPSQDEHDSFVNTQMAIVDALMVGVNQGSNKSVRHY